MQSVLREGTNCWKLAACEQAGVLVDGAAYYAAFYDTALRATRSLLIAGWQFDSNVTLLRGQRAQRAEGPVKLLPFLTWLCERTPTLHIYVLAWDFSVVYALEREWFQQWVFAWNTNERFVFRFDKTAPVAGSHHQKFAVVDEAVAFVGGIDLCARRWDDRQHLQEHPERVDPDGAPSGAYHDVQAWATGPVAGHVAQLFRSRWKAATGQTLQPGRPAPLQLPVFAGNLPVRATRAALCRTSPPPLGAPADGTREILEMVTDAIMGAERLVYIETQYFSSPQLLRTLLRRIRDRGRPLLDIVLVMPQGAEAFKEEVAVGLQQARVLRALSRAAGRTGHRLGVYFPAGPGGGGATYVHAKVMIVDDTLLSVGSANLTNRSMGLDTELNLVWEASPESPQLSLSIRAIRQDLLAEHAGAERGSETFRSLAMTTGLVARLDELALSDLYRIRKRPLHAPLEQSEWVRAVGTAALTIDPARPPLHAIVGEILPPTAQSWFAQGISSLAAALKKGA